VIAQCVEALTALGAPVLIARDEAGVAQAVTGALQERGVTEVVAWDDPVLERFGLAGAAEAAGIRWVAAVPGTDAAGYRATAVRAGAGVTTADYAVAETGTLVLAHGAGRPRMTSLLPPVHLAVVPADRCLPDMAALFDRLGGGQPPTNLTFVTGASRTGDIEHILIRKVHGPGELVVVIAPPES